MSDEPTLPGFDLEQLNDSSVEDLSAEKNYTAERLLVSHPDRYQIAARMFFEVGFSKRGICDLCKLNSRTLNAIIERELASRGAEILFEKIRRKKALIAYQLTEQLELLAQDTDACSKVGIDGLLQAIKQIQSSDPKKSDEGKTVDADFTSSNENGEDPSSFAYAKIYKMSDLRENGLDNVKNSAARVTDQKKAADDRQKQPSASSRSIQPSYG